MFVRITLVFFLFIVFINLNGFSYKPIDCRHDLSLDPVLRYAAVETLREPGDEYLINIERPLQEIEDERRVRKNLGAATIGVGKFVLIFGVLGIGLVLYSLRST
jgi:hypothetical protein